LNRTDFLPPYSRPGPKAESELELVAQEQVLDHKVVPLTEEGGQSRQEHAEEFKHPGRVADGAGRSFALLQLHVGEDAAN
jgi:hypothetical protein